MIEMRAPGNPYRLSEDELSDEMMFGATLGEEGSGPGLLGSDIDRIARQHHAMGRREAEVEAEQKVDAMQRQLAAAYDEGFAAARVEAAAGFADHVRSAIMAGPWFPLVQLRDGPKGKAHEGLPAVVEGLGDIMRFLEAVADGEMEASAEALAVDRLMIRRVA